MNLEQNKILKQEEMKDESLRVSESELSSDGEVALEQDQDEDKIMVDVDKADPIESNYHTKYTRMHIMQFIDSNSNLKWCPAKFCCLIIEKLKDNAIEELLCHCGTHYVFSRIGLDEDVEWIKKNTKKCPGCKSNIQKVDGCN